MTVRRLRYAFLFAAMAGAGAYVFVYLYRWEWNRALMAGLLFLIAEVALVGAAILDRVRRWEPAPVVAVRDERAGVLARLEQSRPELPRRFAWLEQTDRASVFVPVLMGAGVVLSALAWLVERIARRTAQPGLERNLANRLRALDLPRGGFVGATAEDSLLLGPQAEWLR